MNNLFNYFFLGVVNKLYFFLKFIVVFVKGNFEGGVIVNLVVILVFNRVVVGENVKLVENSKLSLVIKFVSFKGYYLNL